MPRRVCVEAGLKETSSYTCESQRYHWIRLYLDESSEIRVSFFGQGEFLPKCCRMTRSIIDGQPVDTESVTPSPVLLAWNPTEVSMVPREIGRHPLDRPSDPSPLEVAPVRTIFRLVLLLSGQIDFHRVARILEHAPEGDEREGR
jgi:hypothetical protein